MLDAVLPLILAIGAFYLVAAVVTLQLVTDLVRFRRGQSLAGLFRGSPRWVGWARGVVIALAAGGLACVADALWVEPFWIQVTQSHVVAPPWARPTSALRIVHLSDLHSETPARVDTALVQRIRDLDPDLIAFTGDALNSPEGLSQFRVTMTDLARVAPTFAVLGNWDVWYWRDLDLYADTGVRLLDGDSEILQLRGVRVWIGGASVDDPGGIERALDEVPPGALTVFLHHYPERVESARARRVDLVLAGDTHGGQVRIPGVGPLIEMQRFGTYYDQGLHRVGDTYLYVNRGLGMEGGSAPRVRFLCRPEVALIEIH